ncbi:TPA: NADPH-dependent FMN reductase [Streptococcus suis]
MANVLFLVGSLREGAFSAELAKTAEKVLEGKASVSYLDWKDIPLFSQDLEADAIWIFSPVYNAAIPGTVKNVLDWLSRSLDLTDTRSASALNEKVTTVSVTSFAHQEDAAAQYRLLLPFIRTNFVDEVTLATNGAPVDKAQLTKQADALLAAIN